MQEARILLGRLEYQRGRIESALRVFDGIDLQAATQKIQPTISDKQPSKKGRARSESGQSASQHPATLLLEGIYIKAKCLQKLEKIRGTKLSQMFVHCIKEITKPLFLLPLCFDYIS